MSVPLSVPTEFSNGTLISYDEPEKYSDLTIALNTALTVLGVVNLFLLMTGMGCAINWRQILDNIWPPIGIIIGMCGQFIILPLLGYLLALLTQLRPYEALGCLIICCCPGGALSNFFTYWVDGDVALSIVMTSCSSLAAFGAMPLNLWIYTSLLIGGRGDDIVIPYGTIFRGLCFVCGPVVLGMVIRHFYGKKADKITKITSILAYIFIAISQGIFFYLYGLDLIQASPLVYLGSLVLPMAGISLAYLVAFALKRPHKICRTIAIETGSQNMPIAMSIVYLTYQDPEIRRQAIIFPSWYGLFMLLDIMICIGLYKLYQKKYENSETEPLDTVHIPAATEKTKPTKQ